MPIPPCEPRGPDDTRPRLGLLAAAWSKSLHETRSHRPDIRAEALQFLEDAEAVAWFGQQLGVEGALEHQVRAVLRDRR